MYRKCLLASLIVLSFACNPEDNLSRSSKLVPKDKNLQVTIINALSSKVDVMNGIYTVFFIDKPPMEVKFKLTSAEREQIVDKFYSLSLHELIGVDSSWKTISIADECMIMPKIYTDLTIKRDSIIQQIRIDESCDEYGPGKSEKAERVKEFLQFIDTLIKRKPEVKSAPESDIFYI